MNIKDSGINLSAAMQANVKAWGAKHRVKYIELGGEMTTKTEDGKEVPVKVPGKLVFFRLPTRQELSAAEHLSVNEQGQSDVYKKAEKMMADCYLGGDLTLDVILNEVETFMAVANFVLYHLVETKNVNWGSC